MEGSEYFVELLIQYELGSLNHMADINRRKDMSIGMRTLLNHKFQPN